MFKPRALGIKPKTPNQNPAKRHKTIKDAAQILEPLLSIIEPVQTTAASVEPTPQTQSVPQPSEIMIDCIGIAEKGGGNDDITDKTSNVGGEDNNDNAVKRPMKSDEGEADAEDDVTVIERRTDQRFPLPGEPVCVVCGRYGEYICDETEHDVCSLECKKIDIDQTRRFFAHPIRTGSRLTSTPATSAPPPLLTKLLATVGDNLLARLTSYVEHADIARLTATQVDSIRASHHIAVKGKNPPRPILSFHHCGLDLKLAENTLQAGYKNPTSIQMQVIPAGLAGRDVLATAETGSGKTAAFLIPIVAHVWSLSQMYQAPIHTGPTALILAPTRELCMQTEQIAQSLMSHLPNMRTALLVGGLPLPNQLHRLRQGVQLAIATPGRLIDILDHHPDAFDPSHLRALVLDEADAMLRFGFEGQVARIVAALPPCQTYLLSATIPDPVNRLARRLLNDPVSVQVGQPSAPAVSVKQTVMWVENRSKKKQLFSLINDPKYFRPPLVVFVESKVGAEMLARAIEKKCGVRAIAMHGDRTQEERNVVMDEFRRDEHQVVVATGVLARGLDLTGVTMVINFDMAGTLDEYVHQIGRAGRVGKKQGWAITFINDDHKHLFRDFTDILKNLPATQVTPLPHQLLRYNNAPSNKRKAS